MEATAPSNAPLWLKKRSLATPTALRTGLPVADQSRPETLLSKRDNTDRNRVGNRTKAVGRRYIRDWRKKATPCRGVQKTNSASARKEDSSGAAASKSARAPMPSPERT